MSSLDKIYNSLPVSLQNIACSIEGWRIQRQRFGGNFRELLSNAEKRSTWSQEQIIKYRNERLSQFIRYCQENIPFYKDYFTRHSLDYRDIKSVEDISVLPIITKQDINNNLNTFLSENIEKRKLIKMHTSGSTGSPFHFYSTKNAVRDSWAIIWRYRQWHGIDFNTWGAYLIGRPVVPFENNKPPFWRINVPGKQLLMSGLHLTSTTSLYYLEQLKRAKIEWIYGYPSLIALLARYKIEENFDLGYQIKWITTNSEGLLPEQKNMIKDAFGINPVQLYGMAEGVATFSECPSGSLHVDEDAAAVEFVKLSNIDGYKIIGTNFSNYGIAFLRYEVNDIIQLSDKHCVCGRPGRIIHSIDGRNNDYIFVTEGNIISRISPTFLYRPFTVSTNIIEGQILQNNINGITIRIVKNEKYTNVDEEIFKNQ